MSLTASDWHGNYEGAPDDGSAWLDEPRGDIRVLRGGAFNDNESYVRAANRFRDLPDLRYNYVGFRVVVSPFSSGL